MTNGLDDVVAAETVLSDVDGQAGRLIIRRKTLVEISGRWPFEDVVALLFSGFFENVPQGDSMARAIGSARCEVFERTSPHLRSLGTLNLYDGVRAGVALMPDGDSLDDALRLVAAPAVLSSMLMRHNDAASSIAPDPSIGHSADMLRMAGHEDPNGLLAAALDTYLVTVSDHGLNASTFAARVVSSTHAGLTSAVLAGMGALKGPLHGGAPGPVIEMLDTIAAHGSARAWLEQHVRGGERLMGFGHRIYNTKIH